MVSRENVVALESVESVDDGANGELGELTAEYSRDTERADGLAKLEGTAGNVENVSNPFRLCAPRLAQGSVLPPELRQTSFAAVPACTRAYPKEEHDLRGVGLSLRIAHSTAHVRVEGERKSLGEQSTVNGNGVEVNLSGFHNRVLSDDREPSRHLVEDPGLVLDGRHYAQVWEEERKRTQSGCDFYPSRK